MSGSAALLSAGGLPHFSVRPSFGLFRLFLRSTSTVGDVAAPTAGSDVDGVVVDNGQVYCANGGRPFRIETSTANGNIAASDSLETDNVGRALKKTTGLAVARALEASTATGTVIWAVFTSGR